jgi:ABC-type transport system involved in multi-copper enzyme maturation permease subunit
VSAFLAIAADVPRKIRRGWLMWILLVLVALILGLTALPLGHGQDPDGTAYCTWFGNDMRAHYQGGAIDKSIPIEEQVGNFVGNFYGYGIACYLGVLAGLILLADAIPSAFAPGQAELNLPKPVHRATIVLARHVGALMVAAFFATLLLGGAVGIAWARTGIFHTTTLVFIPVSVAMFGVLHAAGAISGVWIQNALLAAFASVAIWLASIGTNVSNYFDDYENLPYPLIVKVLDGLKVAHRVLPRPTDLPPFAQRILLHKLGTGPLGMQGEVELAVQTLVWWGLALGLAVLVLRRRDF